jgi:hypothetical protein
MANIDHNEEKIKENELQSLFNNNIEDPEFVPDDYDCELEVIYKNTPVIKSLKVKRGNYALNTSDWQIINGQIINEERENYITANDSSDVKINKKQAREFAFIEALKKLGNVNQYTDIKYDDIKKQSFLGKYEVSSSNKYVIIYIKRFTLDVHFQRVKIKAEYKCIDTLNINNVMYRLKGFIHQSGGTDGGHYIYYKCNWLNNSITVYNDRNSSDLNYADEIQRLKDTGYLYLYEKVNLNTNKEDNNNKCKEDINILLDNLKSLTNEDERRDTNIDLQKYIKYKNKYTKLNNKIKQVNKNC